MGEGMGVLKCHPPGVLGVAMGPDRWNKSAKLLQVDGLERGQMAGDSWRGVTAG